MLRLLSHLIASALLGAVIGAVAGLVTSEFMLEGAVVGAIIGAYLGTRIKAYRAASASAIRHHVEGTRSVDSTRNELIQAARLDQQLPRGIHAASETKRRDD